VAYFDYLQKAVVIPMVMVVAAAGNEAK